MSTATPEEIHSRDVALAAIAQAYRQIGHAVEQLVQVDETAFKLEKEENAMGHPANEQPRSVEPGRGSSRNTLVLRSLMGLLALACIGVAAFAWPSPHGQAATEPISTASVSIVKKELPAQQAPYNTNVAAKTDAALLQPSSQAQTTPQRNASAAPTAAPMAPDLAQSIQMMVRELANLEQGITNSKRVSHKWSATMRN
jgi:hypothetical protein